MLLEDWVPSAPLIVPPLKLGNYSMFSIRVNTGNLYIIIVATKVKLVTILYSIIRDTIVGKCRQKGLVIGGCGEATIRMRPSLIFEPRHAETMIEVMNDVVGSINMSN